MGSDYFSQVSPGSSSVSSASDMYRVSPVSPVNSDTDTNTFNYDKTISSTSSYFRSPKLSPKVIRYSNKNFIDLCNSKQVGKATFQERARLRKTNSWAYPTNSELTEFSLFSPATNNDILSGVRKHLSKIDINEET